MEKIIFFGLIIPILIFMVYLGGKAVMTGFSAKSSNKSNLESKENNDLDETIDNPDSLSAELDKLNELLKSGVLTQEEFEKAKKKILDS